VELEGLLTVKRHYRDTLPVLAVEDGIHRDIHFLQLEGTLGANGLDRLPGLLAEVTARLAIEGDRGQRLPTRLRSREAAATSRSQKGTVTHSLRENMRVWSPNQGELGFVDCE
jgi:hypothetical protein